MHLACIPCVCVDKKATQLLADAPLRSMRLPGEMTEPLDQTPSPRPFPFLSLSCFAGILGLARQLVSE